LQLFGLLYECNKNKKLEKPEQKLTHLYVTPKLRKKQAPCLLAFSGGLVPGRFVLHAFLDEHYLVFAVGEMRQHHSSECGAGSGVQDLPKAGP
jgi:hypothetical protein